MEPVDRVSTKSKGLINSPFWVGVFVVWIIMLILGFTLALALGIWNLIGAF